MKLILLSSYYYLVFILFSQLSGTVLSVPVELSLDANYQLKWNVESDEKEEIIFEVTAYTPGYAGFGISETGGMRGADIVVITILPDGTLELKVQNNNKKNLNKFLQHFIFQRPGYAWNWKQGASIRQEARLPSFSIKCFWIIFVGKVFKED